MKGLFTFLTELTRGIVAFSKSTKSRYTTKALLTANRIKRLDRLIISVRKKHPREAVDIRKIQLLERKKAHLWRVFDKYIAAN